MKVLEKINEAEQQVLQALSATQERVVEGVTAARSAAGQASELFPDLPKVDLPDVELPTFAEVVDNLTDFWLAVLEHNRAFAHRLHGAVTAAPKAKRATRSRSTGSRSTKTTTRKAARAA